MAVSRIALAMALGLTVASAAESKVRCPDRVELAACIGIPAGGTIRFCFRPEAACVGTGVVRSVGEPGAPFEITGMRVQGALGTRTIGSASFPLVLAPGESLLIDVSGTPPRSGEQKSSVELVLANRLDEGDPGGKVEGDACDVDLRMRAPACLPAGQAEQCAAETCVDGTCRPAPKAAICDDGDACTHDDRCTDQGCAGTPTDCDDGIACTDDACTGDGGCTHAPTDARCDSGDCSVAACLPDDAAADARGCVESTVGEGEACTDDGVACTEDVCTGGTCLHVPLDTRCPGAASCGSMACAPGTPGGDGAGCVVGPAAIEGGVCAEDGDPCSDDRCRAGTCEHQAVEQHLTCAPVENAFRRSLALLALTRTLEASTEAVSRTQPAVGRSERLTSPLVRLDEALAGAVDALSGRTVVPVTPSPLTGIPETPAQARARAALLLAGRMPLDAESYLVALSASRRQGLERAQVRALMDDGRALRRGVKRLKLELKRLRRSSVHFAR
jgi:hypothetical protein